jgi:DNA-binding CsgD family transcriptional regulator
MYLKWTSEFIRFLNYKDHTVEEMLGHLVLCALSPLNASSSFIATLNAENSVTTIGRFGIPHEISEKYSGTFPLTEKLPITDAIRLRKTVIVNDLPIWPLEYPLLVDTAYDSNEVCFIALPIERSDTPVGVIGIFFSEPVHLNPDVELFLQSIGHLLSCYLFPVHHVESISLDPVARREKLDFSDGHDQLTDRQLLILRLVSQGHTNASISELLTYSESTVRQETIKIFTKLHCTGREEAGRIYLDEKFAASNAS